VEDLAGLLQFRGYLEGLFRSKHACHLAAPALAVSVAVADGRLKTILARDRPGEGQRRASGGMGAAARLGRRSTTAAAVGGREVSPGRLTFAGAWGGCAQPRRCCGCRPGG